MTVTVVKSDIPGSQMSLGYRDFNKDAAVRKFYVTAATTDDKDDIFTAVFSAIGSFHNELTDLPLQTLTANRAGIGRWIVTAVYNRAAAGGLPQSGNVLSDMAASFTFETIVAKVDGSYEEGLPAGPINMPASLLTDSKARGSIVRQQISVPLIKIKLPFSRGLHPLITYGSLVGKINSNQFQIVFGFNAKINTLLFEGITSRAVATATGTVYAGTYNFLYKPTRHVQQVEFWDETERPQWNYGVERVFESASFPASFS